MNKQTEVTAFSRLPVEHEIDIPLNVIVPCPKNGTINKRQFNRFAANCCKTCECFRGFARLTYADTQEEENKIQEMLRDGKIPWTQVYAIRCAVIYEIPCDVVDFREY